MRRDSGERASLELIQPIVLVGGKSTRFGRDKLREPIGSSGSPLVLRSIELLRSVFGRRVKVVGECHPDVQALADGVIVDDHPGIGPIGGIASALRHTRGAIFVLAGDMPAFSASSARALLAAEREHPRALAILAATSRAHPCAGVYRHGALNQLAACIARGHYRLSGAVAPRDVIEVACDEASLANVNEPREL